MGYYTGLDVSNKTTAICIVDERGKIVVEQTVDTAPSVISDFLTNTGLQIERIGLESGFISHWLASGLKTLGQPVICLESRKVAAILETTINKTDRNDARGIAEILRSGFYIEVHLKSNESMELGSLLQARDVLVRTKIAMTNAVRGLLRTYGLRLDKNKEFVKAATDVIQDQSVMLQHAIVALLIPLKAVFKQLENLDDRLEVLARADERVRLLETVPGVGPITALAFIAEIDNASRFKNSRNVAAYLGLTPSQYSSGETSKQGRISKQGSPMVRTLLVGAGTSVLTRVKSWSRLKSWGMRKQKKMGHRKTAVAIGRKLAVILHRMLVTGKPFEPGEEKKTEKTTEKKTGKTTEKKTQKKIKKSDKQTVAA